MTEPPVAKAPWFADPVTESSIQQARKTAVPKSKQADIYVTTSSDQYSSQLTVSL